MEEDKGERKRVVKKKKRSKKNKIKIKGRVRYVSMQGNLQNENYNCIRKQEIITKVSK